MCAAQLLLFCFLCFFVCLFQTLTFLLQFSLFTRFNTINYISIALIYCCCCFSPRRITDEINDGLNVTRRNRGSDLCISRESEIPSHEAVKSTPIKIINSIEFENVLIAPACISFPYWCPNLLCHTESFGVFSSPFAEFNPKKHTHTHTSFGLDERNARFLRRQRLNNNYHNYKRLHGRLHQFVGIQKIHRWWR